MVNPKDFRNPKTEPGIQFEGMRFVNAGLGRPPHSQTRQAWADPTMRKEPQYQHHAQTTQASSKEQGARSQKQEASKQQEAGSKK